jgi:chemotaxis signal transduction protein
MQLADKSQDTQMRNAISFQLAGRPCAIELRHVFDIVRYDRVVTTQERQDPIERGLSIDLCGEAIEIVDLRAHLDLRVPRVTEETCILIVESLAHGERHRVGLIVDKVCDVVAVSGSRTDASDTLIAAEFVSGVARTEAAVATVLDVPAILQSVRAGPVPPALRAA